MKTPDFCSLFAPENIVVFGASPRPESVGGRVFENLLSFGFKGKVIPINPKWRTVRRHNCYPDLAGLEGTIDLAVIATPAQTVPEILEQCGLAKIPAAIVLSAGFAETGAAGQLLQDQVLSAAQRANVRFIGPNCLGVMRPSAGLNATFSKNDAEPGDLALISQSGALCTAILDWAKSQDVGFSTVVSLGATADIDLGEMLDFLTHDEKTKSILLYIEGIHHARSFLRGLRAAAQLKPVIVMKAGRHQAGAKAAVSHTGALVGADDVFDAALERTGAVRVRTFEELFSAARILSSDCQVDGNGLAIVSNAGGPGVIAADCAAELEVRLPELETRTLEKLNASLPPQWSHANPIDLLGDAGVERYRAALGACLADDTIDAVLAILTPQSMTDPTAVAQATIAAHIKSEKPVLACWMGGSQVEQARRVLTEADIPSFTTPECAMTAFSHLAQYRRNQKMMLETSGPLLDHHPANTQLAHRIIKESLDSGRKELSTIESKRVLEAFQIPVIPTREAASAQEAIEAAGELGYPVVLKINSPELTHKSDVGGIELNLADAAQVKVGYQVMLERVKRIAPEANIHGVTVEPMFRPLHARELIVGVIEDEVFGPAVCFGSGGVTVEVFKDRVVALPPLNEALIHDMISRTKVARLLGPFRNMPPVDEAQLVQALLRLSQIVCELPEIVELDINPLVAHPGGVMALDARIVVRSVPSAQARYEHLAILPE